MSSNIYRYVLLSIIIVGVWFLYSGCDVNVIGNDGTIYTDGFLTLIPDDIGYEFCRIDVLTGEVVNNSGLPDRDGEVIAADVSIFDGDIYLLYENDVGRYVVRIDKKGKY